MRTLNLPLGIVSLVIALIVMFMLLAPQPILSKVLNPIGDFIQMIVAWVKNLFTSK